MTGRTASFVAGVVLDESRCRVAVARPDGTVVAATEGGGARGLGDADRWDAGAVAVADLIDETMVDVVRGDVAVARRGARLQSIVVGVASAHAAGSPAAALARFVASRCAAPHVAVTTEAVAAHAGARRGEPGVVLVAETTAVAWGLSGVRCDRAEGWDQQVSGEGGDASIGREALRAVVSAADGQAPDTAMAAPAKRMFGPVDRLRPALSTGLTSAYDAASFVPSVVRCAKKGDEAAADVLRRAAASWVEATVAVAHAVGEQVVTCVGALTGIELLRREWESALPHDLRVVPAAGTPVDGAALLAAQPGGPYDIHLHRN